LRAIVHGMLLECAQSSRRLRPVNEPLVDGSDFAELLAQHFPSALRAKFLDAEGENMCGNCREKICDRSIAGPRFLNSGCLGIDQPNRFCDKLLEIPIALMDAQLSVGLQIACMGCRH
jgi:hypothetical protein